MLGLKTLNFLKLFTFKISRLKAMIIINDTEQAQQMKVLPPN